MLVFNVLLSRQAELLFIHFFDFMIAKNPGQFIGDKRPKHQRATNQGIY